MVNEIKIIDEVQKEHQKILVYQLSCADGTTAVISNYGCILLQLWVKDKEGNRRDVLLGFDGIESYFDEAYLKNYPYFGAVIGRCANRIKQAKFMLQGTEIQLSKNADENCLHGGFEGFDKKVWQVIRVAANPNPTITMQYISADGEEGFPGEVNSLFTFTLFSNAFEYKIEQHSNADTAVNCTYHPYFNLDETHQHLGQQKVKIYADSWLQQDEQFCATGKLNAVANTSFDFNNWQPVLQEWNAVDGFDQSYVTNQANSAATPVAEALSTDEKLQLKVFSTEPIVHFYTGKYIPEIVGKNENKYGPFCGFCFETQGYPNAVNISTFPTNLLPAGKVKQQTTLYKF